MKPGTTVYRTLHQWLDYHFKPKPENDWCDHCLARDKRLTWANVGGAYRKDRAEYLRLCYKCHFKFDKLPQKARLRVEERWRTSSICKRGHDMNMSGYYQYGRERRCKSCQYENSRRYLDNKLGKNEQLLKKELEDITL